MDRRVGKTDAVVSLADRAGIGAVDPYHGDLDAVFEAARRFARRDLIQADSAGAPGVACHTVHGAARHVLPPPDCRNGAPASFPARFGVQESPAFVVASVPGGVFAQVGRAGAAFLPDRRTLLRDHSSRYAPLAAHYEVDLDALLDAARPVAGAALVLCDDIHPLNYCHFLADTVPRLAALGRDPAISVVTSEQQAPFTVQALALCGVGPERVVALPDFAAVRAETLLVPSDCHAIPHPAYKGAGWALDFVRSRIGMAAERMPPRRIYVSRGDAGGRRVLNEAALMRVLAPAGFERVTLAGRSLTEQAGLFAAATHVVGLHGAGLTNVVFCRPGALLLEILPASYGTPAFWILAAGSGVRYASYVARDVRAGSRPQVDDVVVDPADFERCCAALL